MKYQLVYDILQASDNLLPVYIFIMFAFLFWIFVYKNSQIFFTKLSKKDSKILTLMFMAIFIFLPINVIIDKKREEGLIKKKYKENKYYTIEGVIHNFDPMPYGGKKEESFMINNIKFKYSDYSLSPGYNNTKSHGGVIDNGLYAKIRYINNVILRLEIAKDTNKTAE